MSAEPLEREHRTSRSHSMRLRCYPLHPWTDGPVVEVTSLPSAWLTDDGDDLRAIGALFIELADWLDEAQMEPEYVEEPDANQPST